MTAEQKLFEEIEWDEQMEVAEKIREYIADQIRQGVNSGYDPVPWSLIIDWSAIEEMEHEHESS